MNKNRSLIVITIAAVLSLTLRLNALKDSALQIAKAPDTELLSLTLAGIEGTQWSFQSSTDLANWKPVDAAQQVAIGADGTYQLSVAVTEEGQVFYRAIEDDGIPAMFKLFDESLEVYVDGSYVVIESTNLPDHPSPYFGVGDPRYETYNGTNNNFRINPNSIQEQSFVYRIPLHPAEATNKSNTNLGSIGIAVNGVAFFNQYAGYL
jgi:hypothetical protein